jgi:hypothetical protein
MSRTAKDQLILSLNIESWKSLESTNIYCREILRSFGSTNKNVQNKIKHGFRECKI